jgi:ABC-type antimicrobial peptide transport system permease subunit
MILENAFRRKGRTAMTMMAVAISMALLVSMLSIAEGILDNAISGIQESKRDIVITGEGIHGIVNGHELTNTLLGDENVSSSSAILGTDWSELLVLNFTDPNSQIQDNRPAIGVGLIPDHETAFLGDESERRLRDLFELQFNQWFSVGDDPHYQNGYSGPWTYEILIDETFAKRHNLSIGDSLFINDHPNMFHINGTFSTILSGEGVFEGIDIGVVVMHLSELQTLMGLEEDDLISSISLSLEDEHKDVSASRAIASNLKNEYPFYNVMTKEDRLDSVSDQMELARIFYTAIGSVSMVIGLLFVACIMIMSVYERTNEFGMMRAIGISKKTIFIQTLLESMVLVVIGAIIGLFLGYFGSQALGDYLRGVSGLNQNFTAFTLQLMIQSLLIIIVFGTFISLYPAWKAARKNIMDALRFIR